MAGSAHSHGRAATSSPASAAYSPGSAAHSPDLATDAERASGAVSVEAGRDEEAVMRYRVRLASPADDAALRGILRKGSMAGAIRLGMEREPSYFASLDTEAERHDTVVLEDPGGGEIVAMGARLVHDVTLGGEAARLGYLNQLRVAPGHRLGRKGLRKGWDRLLDRRRPDELPFDLTSIAADNRAARRLLERGLPGLPRYHPILEYEVLAIPTVSRGPGAGEVVVHEASAADRDRAEALLRRQVAHGALVLRWRGMGPGDASGGRATAAWQLVARRRGSGEIVAGLSVVDPTPWRQYVIRGYEGGLRWTRPLANVALRLSGAPLLPPPGGRLRSGFIVGLFCRSEGEDAVAALLGEASRRARRKGISTLLYGAPVGDPVARLLARWYRPRRYRTVHYLVARDEPGAALERLRAGPLHIDPLVL